MSLVTSLPLIRPRPLLPGAHVAVLAASGSSDRVRIEEAARYLEARGLRVTIADNVDHRDRGYLAGSDDERAAVINAAFRDDDFDGFFFARGGYGAMRILDRLDYGALRRNPRPVIGFSDVTAIHQAIALHAGVGAFHGPMLNLDFHAGLSPDIDRWFWSLLAGEAPMTHHFEASQVVQHGTAEGVLFGGCLSLTTALLGTPYDFWIDDGIWFWEDVDEPLYRIDRMLTHLRLSGRFRAVRGVVIGQLKGCGDEAALNELLGDFFGSRDIPVVRNFPFGHHGNNLLLPIGIPSRFSTQDGTLTITTPAVAPMRMDTR